MNFMLYLLLLPGAFLAPVIHEFAKARISMALGDITLKNRGFRTWNPLKFFEPIGFFLMMYFRVGWGQPVPVSPLYYKDRRKGIILTYTIPILINILIGLLVLAVWRLLRYDALVWASTMQHAGGITWLPSAVVNFDIAILFFAQCNIGLAIFNLIPIHPMAGSKLLPLFVSPETAMRMSHYEKPMQIILFIMLIFGVVQGAVVPVRDFIISLVWL